MKWAIRSNVTSAIFILFQFQNEIPKNSKKLKISKTVNLTKKVQESKKDVKHDFTYIGSIKYPVSSTI